MEITSKALKRVDVVMVKGRIDHQTAPDLDEALKAITDANRFRLVVDLSSVDYISSAGLKVLLAALKRVKRWNRGDLRLVGLQSQVQNVFGLAGLTPLFRIYNDAVDAVGSF